MYKSLGNTISVETIKQVLHKLDLMSRPYVVFMHPEDAEAVKASYPEIEDKAVIQITPFMEKGKAIIAKREDLEFPPVLKSVEFVSELSKYHE
jgi:Fe-S oxidoreductase